MPGRRCNKIIHLTEGSAERHKRSLGKKHGGTPPNVYKCTRCSSGEYEIFHVGYGFDASKLSKKARRRRKEAKARNRRRS